MAIKRKFFAGLLFALLFTSLALAQQAKPTAPPKSRTENVKEVLHGVEVVDPYRWLEDQSSPETRKWIEEQIQYTDSLLGALPSREGIAKRLGELLKVDTIGLPTERGGRYFFSMRRAEQELAVLYMRKGLTGADEVLVDPHPMSPDRRTTVGFVDISEDGSLVAYSVRQGGADEIEIRFLDVNTRQELPDRMPTTRYFGLSMLPDKSGCYYTKFTKEGGRVYFHKMGTDLAQDVEVFGKGVPADKIVYAGLSENGKHLIYGVVHGASADQVDVYYQDAARTQPVKTIVKDVPARFQPDFAGDQLLLHTNWKAPNSRVLAVDLKNPAMEKWREVIPEGKFPLEGISLAGGRIYGAYTENASSRIRIYELNGKAAGEVPLPALGTVSGVLGRWESKEAFYSYASFLTPTTIYRYEITSGKSEVWARPNVPVESDRFEVKQVWYASKDGTRVPMFLVHAKGLQLNGSNPTYLTGYGGFNSSSTPSFTARAVVWVERGGVFALPNLRGGGEFGEEWHKAGMLDKKQNVFDDFIAAAEWLVKQKYTKPERLAIAGGSNGGLLVGAAMTQRPDLFGAVLCAVPLLDMLRYHNFLVARWWVPEYGSADDAAQFRYLRAYSPYHNVKQGTRYPAVIFTTGDNDTRVAPLHARKMTALMQAATASNKPIVLHYDTKSGHIGAKPINKTIADTTDELSFLLWQLGMEK